MVSFSNVRLEQVSKDYPFDISRNVSLESHQNVKIVTSKVLLTSFALNQRECKILYFLSSFDHKSCRNKPIFQKTYMNLHSYLLISTISYQKYCFYSASYVLKIYIFGEEESVFLLLPTCAFDWAVCLANG